MKAKISTIACLATLIFCVIYTITINQSKFTELNDLTHKNIPELETNPQVGILNADEIPFNLQLLPPGDSRGIAVSGSIKTPQVTYSTLSPELQGKISTEFEPKPRFRKGGYNYQELDPEELANALSKKPGQVSVNKSLVSSISAGGQVTNSVNNGGFIFIPADPHGAAGPDQVVNVFNTTIEFYDTDGSNGSSQSLESFFAPLNPVNFTFDPKVLYDQYEQQFVVVTLERQDTSAGDPSNTSRLLVAVSATSDPNGLWYMHSINSKVFTTFNGVGADRWFDYPGLAVDEEVIYLNGNMFGYGVGGYGGVRLWMIEKTGFYTGGAASVIGPLDPYAGSLNATTTQPAHTYGVVPAGMGTYLMSYSRLSNGVQEFWQVVRIDDPTGTPNFDQQFINVGDIEPNGSALPSAPQSGTALTVETNDPRALDAVWRDGQIFSSATLESQSQLGETSASWWVFNGNGGGATLAENGIVDGEDISAGTFTFFPSIAVNADGGIGLGYSASSPTIFPGSYFSVRSPDDAAGTMRPSEVIRAGTDFYHRTFGGTNRWGDYSAVAIDPNDECFWVYNKHAVARSSGAASENGLYETAFGEFCNQSPSAGGNSITVDEDGTVTIVNNGDSTVLNNDSDPDTDDTLTTLIVSGPSDASSFTLNLDGTFSYTHNGDENSSDSFVYEACDDGTPVKCDSANVNIAINNINDDPDAINDGFMVSEDDASTIFNLTNNDTDAEGDDVEINSINTTGTTGAVSIRANNDAINYDPDGQFETLGVGESAQDSFAYTVEDGNGGNDTATVTITINGANDEPIANADDIGVNEDDGAANFNLTNNDDDLDGDDIEITSINTIGTVGTVSIRPNNDSIRYNPNGMFETLASGEIDTDSFTYSVEDGNGGNDTNTVSVQITGANDDPTASDDDFDVNEDDASTTLGFVLNNDSDVDVNDQLIAVAFAGISGTSGGLGLLNTDGEFEFDPNGDFESLAAGQTTATTFTYTVDDSNEGFDTATITVTVNGVNDDPVAANDATSTDEDTLVSVNVLANDSDVDTNDSVNLVSCSSPVNGTVVKNGNNCDFTPAQDFNGQGSFDYTINDGNGGSDSATVTVTIDAVDDAPVAVNDGFTVNEDSGLSTFAVIANDTDIDNGPLNIISVGSASGGVSAQNGNSVNYTPNDNFCGDDSFTYELNGGSEATVSVTVSCVDDAPVAVNDGFTVNEDSGVNVLSVTDNDTDVDDGPLNITDVSSASNGAAIQMGNNIEYTPNDDFCGDDSFIYDLNGGTQATVDVTVACVNDEPSMSVNEAVFVALNDIASPPTQNLACQFDFGPNNEDGSQAVNDMVVIVQNDPSGVLTSVDVDNTGQVNYVFTGNSGVAEVTVALQDNGGTDNSGVDTSQAYTFSVNVQDYVFRNGFDQDVCQ